MTRQRSGPAKTTWVLRRRPLGISAFRDLYPYFHAWGGGHGSFWVQDLRAASRFTSRASARAALKKIHIEDKHVVLVRVMKVKR